MNKGKIIFYSVIGIIGTVGLILLGKKAFGAMGNKFGNKNDQNNNQNTNQNNNQNTNTTTTGSGLSSGDSFPLIIGSRGAKVKALQKALSIAPQDGILGNQTKSFITAAGYSLPLSETNYNKIVNPVAPTGVNTTTTTTAWKKGDYVYIDPTQGTIAFYSYPSTAASYLLGTAKQSTFLTKPVATYDSAVNSSWNKIKLTVGYTDPHGNAVTSTELVFAQPYRMSKSPY